MRSTRFPGFLQQTPPAHFFLNHRRGAAEVQVHARNGVLLQLPGGSHEVGNVFPIICATTGRPVGFSVMDRKIGFSSRESACTRKYSVK
ncbi:MAG: hypothetical protein CM1200mP29_03050 [Verrucomicrobiota bacterium]|nr:MAG: hypothetical protein CM1200mP29_03050 [Verrucomicrobiota bacterium]